VQFEALHTAPASVVLPLELLLLELPPPELLLLLLLLLELPPPELLLLLVPFSDSGPASDEQARR
jgi:hypothetical protein